MQNNRPGATSKITNVAVTKIAKRIAAKVARLRESGFSVLLVSEPVTPVMIDDPKLANKKREDARLEAVQEIEAALRTGGLASVSTSTLQKAVSVRSLLQGRVMADPAILGCGAPVLMSTCEADFSLAALAKSGSVDAVMTVDSGVQCRVLPAESL